MQAPASSTCFNSTGGTQELNGGLNAINFHLKMGSIVPIQDSFTTNVNTTVDLEAVYTDLHILTDPSTGSASGYVVYDGTGETVYQDGTAFWIQMSVSDVTISFS